MAAAASAKKPACCAARFIASITRSLPVTSFFHITSPPCLYKQPTLQAGLLGRQLPTANTKKNRASQPCPSLPSLPWLARFCYCYSVPCRPYRPSAPYHTYLYCRAAQYSTLLFMPAGYAAQPHLIICYSRTRAYFMLFTAVSDGRPSGVQVAGLLHYARHGIYATVVPQVSCYRSVLRGRCSTSTSFLYTFLHAAHIFVYCTLPIGCDGQKPATHFPLIFAPNSLPGGQPAFPFSSKNRLVI